MNNLSKEHIDQLFEFIKSKYVRYYDVQLDLVDHIAAAIEDKMSKDNELTFQQALQKVYSGFPITGFNNFIHEKQKGLQIFWAKKFFFVFALDYFRLPKIILTIVITLFLFYISQHVVQLGVYQMNGLSLVLLAIILIQRGRFFKLQKLFRRSDNNNLLCIATFNTLLFTVFYIPYLIIFQNFIFPENPNWAISISGQVAAVILSVTGVATIILAYGIRTKGLEWINEEIYKKYPEYFAINKILNS